MRPISIKGRVKRRPRIGFQAPIKGGLHEALIVALDTGCDTVQIFSRNPRGWAAKPLTAEDVSLFRKTRRRTKIDPVVIHSNYLVNLAAADEVMLESRALLFVKKLSGQFCWVSIISSCIRVARAERVKPAAFAPAPRASSSLAAA
ncbi:MAG: hypothetical protein ACREA9_05675 [Pyrinomonadaceae bacterium]